ncbi:hypothetical protein TIFTF001_026792 [Ficus carica]|uniref:Uncharacterized protein n=1 Tax=Ficus carica TaxID=3494 RepID=A0AA88IZ76_FICCA|nr:hypothetical protein TIFTF001_026792 [Ficus carica]
MVAEKKTGAMAVVWEKFKVAATTTNMRFHDGTSTTVFLKTVVERPSWKGLLPRRSFKTVVEAALPRRFV